MIGAIIGDIVGSRFEFNNTRDGNFALFSPECSFTDDTICTVAVADAILRGEDYRTSILRWCRKYPNPMGAYGASFALWLNSPDPQPYNSFGNGAAMRVSPVAYAFDTEQEVIRQAMETAKITHDHPDGIIGAMVVARAIYLMRSCDPFCDVLALNQALEMVGSSTVRTGSITSFRGVSSTKRVRGAFRWPFISSKRAIHSRTQSARPFSTAVIAIRSELSSDRSQRPVSVSILRP